MREQPEGRVRLPDEPIHRITAPLERFMHVEAASGIVLLAATVAALVLANSPLSERFLDIWKTEVGLRIGSFEMVHSLKHWINDGLMAVFFFVIGLEVKRELLIGELRDPRRAALPVFAAIGGMVVPAGVYLALQAGEPGARGWGIPMATDIAFVVGCMAVLGRRVPHGLRVMLLSLAIADDIGAILVIAIGYTESLNLTALFLGLVGLVFVLALSRLGVRNLLAYTVVGALVWLAFHESGVHATIAGVLLGLLTPTKAYISEGLFGEALTRASEIFHGGHWGSEEDRGAKVLRFRQVARETIPPVEFLETLLHPWVGFFVMPLFALANAGVPFQLSDLADPVAQAVAAGLVIGKPVGIVGLSFIAIRTGLARLPEGVSWGVLTGGGFLAAIGFTMALFIAGLALQGEMLDAAKVGVLGASLVAAVIGMSVLSILLPKRRAAEEG
ncbi:MAG: Na+/H+ antiporter NhaA [Gemmatimonadota bacterium]|nr:MAG: Na+/H+ antiporter NhaA [Gemmatimonadota bacterium]